MGFSCSPELPQTGFSPRGEKEGTFWERMEMGCASLSWGGAEPAGPRGVKWGSGGAVLLLQDVHLVGRRVGGLGGTLPGIPPWLWGMWERGWFPGRPSLVCG